jgi:hypothetical protein
MDNPFTRAERLSWNRFALVLEAVLEEYVPAREPMKKG